MDIKSKNYSHSIITKFIVFIIVIFCFTGSLAVFLDIVGLRQGNFDVALEKEYFLSNDFRSEYSHVTQTLSNLIGEYKSEEHILSGGTVTEERIQHEKDQRLYSEFEYNVQKGYNHNLSQQGNYKRFEEIYADEIAQIKEKLIAQDLKQYNSDLRILEGYEGIIYYASDGEHVFTNSPNLNKEYFKSFPSYLIFDKAEAAVFPERIKDHNYQNSFYWLAENINSQQSNAIYLAYPEEYLQPRIAAWNDSKAFITYSLKQIIGFTLGLAIAFIFLLIIIGRRHFGDREVHFNFVDRLYNDFNLALCLSLIVIWIALINFTLFEIELSQPIVPLTMGIGTLGLILVLSLVKHIKNGTIFKHTLAYTVLHKLYKFIKDIYDSGSVAVRVVLIIVGYPALVALTFFMFPITIGVAAWQALKKVKEFNAIKEGVKRVKAGDIHHTINVSGTGEFARLAADLNGITGGLNKAVANELKSDRLKTELITNVSHDIRTPLTSIITYVDLLKNETEPTQIEEYVNIIEQKAQRLKVLTEDLFEASKASSGNIPVNYERIDLAALITQGLGELNDKINELELDFKIKYTQEKVYIQADGKLLWRAIENLLSNIFKYALPRSRVYIDIEDLRNEVRLVFKNISAHELNISAEELMERFKRGDEARSSQGSGLGLSIAKSLIEIQKGSFTIEIDGDLFKASIQMPKENQ